jgi:hypothetical protein
MSAAPPIAAECRKQSPALWISEPKKKTRDWSIDHSALHVREEMVLTTLRRQAQESPFW